MATVSWMDVNNVTTLEGQGLTKRIQVYFAQAHMDGNPGFLDYMRDNGGINDADQPIELHWRVKVDSHQ